MQQTHTHVQITLVSGYGCWLPMCNYLHCDISNATLLTRLSPTLHILQATGSRGGGGGGVGMVMTLRYTKTQESYTCMLHYQVWEINGVFQDTTVEMSY